MTRSLSSSRLKVTKRQTLKPPQVKAKSKLVPVAIEAIELIETPCSRERGGGPGEKLGSYRRMASGQVSLASTWIDDPIQGHHPSFRVFLNRPSKGPADRLHDLSALRCAHPIRCRLCANAQIHCCIVQGD